MSYLKSTNYRTQADGQMRYVALANLIAMCERASGVVHTYDIPSAPGKQRVALVYSNPDEYGNDAPVICFLPVVPNPFEEDNPYVILSPTSIQGGRDKEDRLGAYQSIDAAVFDADPLYRTKPNADDWRTELEVVLDNLQRFGGAGCHVCRAFVSDYSAGLLRDRPDRVKRAVEHVRVNHVPGGGSTAHLFVDAHKET